MKAADFPYEVGDVVYVVNSWDDSEKGTITSIPDGEVIDEVEVRFMEGDYGVYSPEDIGDSK